MPIVIIGSLLTAGILLLQGVHVLKTGNMRPFFLQSKASSTAVYLKRSARLGFGVLYLLSSAGILYVLAFILANYGSDRLLEWLGGHIISLFGGVFLLIYGLTAVFRPDVVLRWVVAPYRDGLGIRLESGEHIIRGIGIAICAIGLWVFGAM